jgi:hypothetical protein
LVLSLSHAAAQVLLSSGPPRNCHPNSKLANQPIIQSINQTQKPMGCRHKPFAVTKKLIKGVSQCLGILPDFLILAIEMMCC